MDEHAASIFQGSIDPAAPTCLCAVITLLCNSHPEPRIAHYSPTLAPVAQPLFGTSVFGLKDDVPLDFLRSDVSVA